MTFGQMSELFCMLLIPWFFRRLGVKYMLVAGMSAWALRYVYSLPTATPAQACGCSIARHPAARHLLRLLLRHRPDLHRPQISPAFRAAAQGTITLITYGAGMLLGSWLSGRWSTFTPHTSPDGVVTHQWKPIWLISADCSAAVLLLFLATFSSKEADATMSGLPAEEMAEGVPL
jgi:hypothetical protein